MSGYVLMLFLGSSGEHWKKPYFKPRQKTRKQNIIGVLSWLNQKLDW